MRNPKEKIVELMRGYYALPILAYLGETGVLDQWLQTNRIRTKNFVQNIPRRLDILRYLNAIGLLDFCNQGEHFCLTEVGGKVLSRHGAFNILHSYKEYFDDVEKLFQDCDFTPKVNREENVYGSGQVHRLKFFKDSFSLVPDDIELHVDIACGDATYLQLLRESRTRVQHSYGVDLSADSVKASLRRIAKNQLARTYVCQEDGFEVKKWMSKLKINSDKKGLVSFWFFLHEISTKEPTKIISLLRQVHQSLPNCDLLICENVAISSEIVASENHQSVVPEFLLFHELSHQGVLSWEEYQLILKQIPYELVAKREYDSIGQEELPSSFIWLLRPIQHKIY